MTHVSTIDWHLLALMKKGWIEIRHDTPRAIRLLREDLPVVPLGAIAAGEPVLDGEPAAPRMPRAVARQFSPAPDYFVTVEDDGLNGLGLTDGRVVAIAAGRVPADGDVVVARVGTEKKLRRFRRIDAGRVELRPESTNRKHKAEIVDAGTWQLHIGGVMVGALIGPATGLPSFD